MKTARLWAWLLGIAWLYLAGCALAEGPEAPSVFPGSPCLTFADRALPFDEADGCWYLPAAEDLAQALCGDEALVQAVREILPQDDLMRSEGFSLGEGKGRAVFTPLPVLAITTGNGQEPGDEDSEGAMAFFDVDESGHLTVLEMPLSVRVRGNTSRRFPKKSWRLELVDEWGEGFEHPLAGLRVDDDWILNPLYSDSSKLREALGYWLWEEMNSCGDFAASSHLRFVEVLLNGRYYGLYALQERVDKKQVRADEDVDILYKISSNEQPTPQELRACTDWTRCKAFELEFAGARVQKPWEPAADLMELLSGGAPAGSVLSEENSADYTLWSVLTQARDNHFKNQYLHAALFGDTYTLYRIPWDLNYILGDLWNADLPETNHVEYDISRLALDDVAANTAFGQSEAFRERLRARWRELRAGAITEENILEKARALFDMLRPAIERDTLRWPESGMGEGAAANIRDIEDYIRQVLPRMDAWLEQEGAEDGRTEGR